MPLNRTPNSLSIFDRFNRSESTIYTVGNVFFVGSTAARALDNADRGDTPESPFATIDFAINQTTASEGDTIIVMPGHTENLTAAIALDVAGVGIVGMGYGNNRPRLVLTGTAGSLTMSANNCWASNLIFACSTANVVSAIACTGDDCEVSFIRVELDDNTTDEFVRMFDFDTADDAIIENCVFKAHTATGATTALRIDNSDRMIVRNNVFTGFYGGATISATDNSAAASTEVGVYDNHIVNLNTSAGGPVDMTDASTGYASNNYLYHLIAAAPETGVDWGDLLLSENYVSNAVDETGRPQPETTPT